MSSGEESVVNGEVNSENDETSKDATSCTDVESVNLNTEGSNTASAACSVGKYISAIGCYRLNTLSIKWRKCNPSQIKT